MTNNLPTLHDIAENPRLLDPFPLAALAAIADTADEVGKRASFVRKAVVGAVEGRFGAEIAAQYQAQQKDTGTVHVEREGFVITGDRAKRVDWDQNMLAAAAEKIRAAGDDPAEYLDISFSVQERRYAAWPSHIKAVFEPARTVKPGALSIKLAPAKSEAA